MRDDFDGLQYRLFIVPSFENGSSLVILKMHHCMCDGVATLVMTDTFGVGGYQKSHFGRLVPPISIADEIVKYVTLPFAIFTAFFSLFGFKRLKKVTLTGERQVLMSKELNLGCQCPKKNMHGVDGECDLKFRTCLRNLGYTPSDLIISIV